MRDHVVNPAALEPLYAPHEEPNRHRARARIAGAPAQVLKGRRKSDIVIAQNLRWVVKQWREAEYPGASDTTRELLQHWFERDHLIQTPDGDRLPFRYYFCQREAIETLIYLHEVLRKRSLSSIVEEFSGENTFEAALGVNPDQDRWPKYAFKVATGAGKTKIMSLAIVWSYFHSLRESDSPLARHFVAIAPNLTVYERLREDFAPAGGGPDVFAKDPLIPAEWLGDWNLSVVLQDEAGGAATGGTLYLTNVHRLYDPKRRTREAETYEWMGPSVSRAKALDTGAALRERVTSHDRVMVLNDEAHHLWDPGSAWNEAITWLNDATAERGGGIAAQLDFSATPKDNQGRIFQHVVCDAPLGEAVDAGIVKTPIIGRGEGLKEGASDNAAEKYLEHLLIGYKRWQKSREEWQKSGKKPLMFVMTEDTEAADQIAHRLNSDSMFKDLNGTTINLHTRLKGRIVRRKPYPVFEESEAEISDEDLKELRKLSRELDSGASPYQCIVSVLMLRQALDERGVRAELVYFASPMEMWAALECGEVSALSAYVPGIIKAEGVIGNIIHWYRTDSPMHPCCDIAVHLNRTQHKLPAVRQLLSGIRQGIEAIARDTARAVAIAAQTFGLSDSVALLSLRQTPFRLSLTRTEMDFELATARQMKELGYIPREVVERELYRFDLLKP